MVNNSYGQAKSELPNSEWQRLYINDWLSPEPSNTFANILRKGALQQFVVPPELFGNHDSSSYQAYNESLPIYETSLSDKADAFAYALDRVRVKTVLISETDLFLLQCKGKFSPKIYHNIERRIRRQQKKSMWLYAPTLRRIMQGQFEKAIIGLFTRSATESDKAE